MHTESAFFSSIAKGKRMPTISRSTGRRLAKFGGGLLLALLLAALFWDVIELLDWGAFLEWKKQVGIVPFFIGLALLPLVGVPTTPLFLIAGATFSPLAASVGCGASIALNLVISYWIANRWLRRPLRRRLRRWNVAWPEHDAKQALHFLLIFRFTPGIPTFIKNYVSALSEIPFVTYLCVSWVITFMYALGFVIMGDSLVNHSPGEAVLGVAVLVLAYFVVKRFRNRSRRASSNEEHLAGTGASEAG